MHKCLPGIKGALNNNPYLDFIKQFDRADFLKFWQLLVFEEF